MLENKSAEANKFVCLYIRDAKKYLQILSDSSNFINSNLNLEHLRQNELDADAFKYIDLTTLDAEKKYFLRKWYKKICGYNPHNGINNIENIKKLLNDERINDIEQNLRENKC